MCVCSFIQRMYNVCVTHIHCCISCECVYKYVEAFVYMRVCVQYMCIYVRTCVYNVCAYVV